MDFSVKFDGIIANMLPDASIKYVINSPAFSSKIMVGDFSYSITFPNTPTNRKIFKFIDRVDIAEEETEKECQLMIKNNFFVNCLFRIEKSNKLMVQGSLINSGYDIINQIKEKTTKDMLFALYNHIFDSYDERVAYLKDSVNHDQSSRPFVIFPLYNNNPNSVTINNDDDTTFDIKLGNYVNGMENQNGTMTFIGPNYVAFPYIGYVIDKIFEYFNYEVDNNVFKSGELAKLVLLNLLKSSASQYNFDAESYLLPLKNGLFYLSNHIVNIRLDKLLEYINGIFCHAFFPNRKNNKFDSVLLKNLLKADYVDWTDKVISKEDKEYGHDPIGYYFHYDFGSDDAFSNYQMSYEDKDIQANYTVDTFAQLPTDATTNQVAYVKALDTYFYWGKKSLSTEETSAARWHIDSFNFFGKKVNDNNDDGTENDPKLSPPALKLITEQEIDGITIVSYNTFGFTGYMRDWTLPYTDQRVVNRWHPRDFSDASPKLCFYRGMVDGSHYINNNWVNFSYPFGSPGNLDPNGNKIGELKLNWDGDEGIYENFWKDWMKILQNQTTVTFNLDLDDIDILNLDLKKRIKIGSNFFLIKQIKMDLPLKPPVQAVLVRI